MTEGQFERFSVGLAVERVAKLKTMVEESGAASRPPAATHYAPSCRKGQHKPINHRSKVKGCDCPCHLGNEATPWWAETRDTEERS